LLVKTDGTDLKTEDKNTVTAVNSSLHCAFGAVSILLYGKPVNSYENSNHYKAYVKKLLNYGTDETATHLVTNFWYLNILASKVSLPTIVMPNI
jgi:hypothetical protein